MDSYECVGGYFSQTKQIKSQNYSMNQDNKETNTLVQLSCAWFSH